MPRSSTDPLEGGLCVGSDNPEEIRLLHAMFFGDTALKQAEAKLMCETCPVRLVCLEEALKREEPYGVWGGMTAAERSALLKQRKKDR